MKREKLLHAIGEIDDDLILDAVHDAKKRRSWMKWGRLAAMLVLCVSAGIFTANLLHPGMFPFGNWGNNATADSIVLLDVNPSIALTVDADERIVAAQGLNEDGIAILQGMNFTGSDITVAVNAVIGSMLQKGYLSDLQNAILVSVENDDAERSAALQKRVSELIGSALQNGNLEGTVLSQTLSDTTDLEQMAQTYQISLGKAALIQEVIALDGTLTAEKLAPLSITEIALISQSKNLSSGAVTQNGLASNKAYISQDTAVGIAYDYAKVNGQDVIGIQVEFDSDDGIMVYEIEFRAGTVKYEFDIDARTGQVVKYETESVGAPNPGGDSVQTPSDTQQSSGMQQPSGTQQPSNTQQPSSQYIGEDAAKEAALTHANISADTLEYINAWIDYDDGRAEHYDVEFVVGNVEYEYKIDLYSGAVLAHEMETHGYHNTHHGSTSDQTQAGSPTTDIGAEAAKSAALSHAGISVSQALKMEVDYDYDDGRAVYEVEFECNGYEYEYKIDAATGTILEYEIDD